MRGYAQALRICAKLIFDHEPVDARRMITENIHQLKAEMAKCENGHNLHLEHQIAAYTAVLDSLYQLCKGNPA